MNSMPMLDLVAPESSIRQPESVDRRGDCELIRRIDTLTYRQVRDLNISQTADRVVLHGRAKSYYVKQLATHAVLDMMPGVSVENSICVVQ